MIQQEYYTPTYDNIDPTALIAPGSGGGSIYDPQPVYLEPVLPVSDVIKPIGPIEVTNEPLPVDSAGNDIIQDPTQQPAGNAITKAVEWAKANPLIAAGIVFGAWYLMKPKKKGQSK